jgi:hypothetical protein
MKYKDKVLILTPVKDAEAFLETYFQSLCRLTYPHDLISVGFLESDSVDNTYLELEKRLSELKKTSGRPDYGKRILDFTYPQILLGGQTYSNGTKSHTCKKPESSPFSRT